jgi:hypothetical protein
MCSTACATAGSEPPSPTVEAPRVPLIVYSRAFQSALADAFEGTAPGSPVRVAIKDYGQLRRAVCAAEGWRQPACRAIAEHR